MFPRSLPARSACATERRASRPCRPRRASRTAPLRQPVHRAVRHRRPHPAGAEAVGTNSLRAVIERDALRQHRERGLRGAVREALGRCTQPGDGGDGDDRPPPFEQMGIAARAVRKAPVTLTRSTSSNMSGSRSSRFPDPPMPALRTSASRPPKRSTVSATARSASPRCPCRRRSRGRRSRQRPPRSARRRRPVTATAYPSARAGAHGGADARAAARDEGDPGHRAQVLDDLLVVDRVAEGEPEALADSHRREQVVLLVLGAEESEGRRSLPDRRDHAVAAARARELVHGRVVVAAGLEPGEVADVDDGRVVVGRP